MKKLFLTLILTLTVILDSFALQAPDFALKDESGKVVELSKLKSEVMFLTFWATSCHSCRDELPQISSSIYPKYKDRVKFYAVVIDTDNPKYIPPIKREWSFNLPVLFGNSDVMEKYRIIGTPTTYIIGKNNNIVKIFIGPQNIEKFEQAIKKALGES